jgi:hypothetical protein
MIGILGVLVAIGSLIYNTAVTSIFAPAKPAVLTQSDSVPPVANPPAPQHTALAAPTAPTAPNSATNPNQPNLLQSLWDKASAKLGGTDSTNPASTESPVQKTAPPSDPNGGIDFLNPPETSKDARPSSDYPVSSQTLALIVSDLASKLRDQPVSRDQAGLAPARAYITRVISSAGLPPASRSVSRRSDPESAYYAALQTMANPTGLADPRDAQTAAAASIAHGGQAAFELQHLHTSTGVSHPARIVITATTLEFIPKGPCPTGPLTIPLASILSVQINQASPQSRNLILMHINFDHGQLTFAGSSASSENSTNGSSPSSQSSVARQAALFTAIRDLILATKTTS